MFNIRHFALYHTSRTAERIRMNTEKIRLRRNERGATIVESVIVMIILLLILFGLLQVAQLSTAKIFADYASFRGARSAAVGFKDYLVDREARIKAIPASGRLVDPARDSLDDGGGAYSLYASEKVMIENYMDGTRWLEYEYWRAQRPDRHTFYKCPFYGTTIESSGSCSVCDTGDMPSVSTSIRAYNERIKTTFRFRNYPLRVPLRDAFLKNDSLDISGESELANHSSAYLN